DVEDNSHTDKDPPRCNVKLIDFVGEPSNNEIVGKSERDGSGNGVVGANVGKNGDLRGDFVVGPEETQKELGERTTGWPVDDWVEDQLVTSIGVLLPTRQFIVDGKRNTFLETSVVIGSETNDKASHLKTKRNIKILRDVLLGP